MNMNFGILILLFGVQICLAAPESVKLNVVLVTADDLGMQLGCYGDFQARTPHLDAFADGGVRFSQFHVSQSSCSSSRSSLLTGLFPHQSGQVGLSNRGFRMREGIESLPTLLKRHGYRTGIIGKLHVEPAAAFSFDYKVLRGILWKGNAGCMFERIYLCGGTNQVCVCGPVRAQAGVAPGD